MTTLSMPAVAGTGVDTVPGSERMGTVVIRIGTLVERMGTVVIRRACGTGSVSAA
ncbi:hypothetical protein ABN028_34185 [Actinopolymorpha sp. B17G11]|uniref:hypothetical protein n=1 Tax=Actinopolymorpha sp. B17G11 TaxID=3160861 RepID=UPI0032E43463